jgi:structural maintenance of chromosome 2
LTRFDTELRGLDEVIKAKKQSASRAEVAIKNFDHEVQALAKEKAGHVTAATNLEKQYEWIAEESQWVKEPVAAGIFADLANARVLQRFVWPSGIAV